MNFSDATKMKLTLTLCDVDDEGKATAGNTSFEALVNPSGYKHISSIAYSKNCAFGPGTKKKFSSPKTDQFIFNELVLDGTGVVDGSDDITVRQQVELLRKVSYNYQGDEHEPPVFEVSWGPLLFQARLKSLTVNYTLFKPNGEPLRAKVDLKLEKYMSTGEIYRNASLESPDLTHLVEVKAGDTLPLLCYQIYKDCSYYLAVARINKLQQFRHLQPGQVLRFPPLV